MNYRLGLDLGTNSLGVWMLALDGDGSPAKSLGGAVRIFSDGRDPQSGSSLAEARRTARAMRRRRDRYLRRRAALLSEMIDAGLMPTDDTERKSLAATDPYVLRVRALEEPLKPGEIGRALFHLNQRRGFKSNRKADRKDAEKGKIAAGMEALHAAMSARNARTYGEFLKMRQDAGETVRARLKTDPDGPVAEYDFYPDRALLEEEFNKIWNAQVPFHPELLTLALKERLFEVIFFQRPLKTPEVGRCLYRADEKRLPKRHPLFQQRRLYETVNQLRIARTGGTERPLTIDERDLVILLLRDKKKVRFSSLRRRLRLGDDERFTIESERRKDLEGDEIRSLMLGTKQKPSYGSGWGDLPWERQAQIIDRLHETEDRDELLEWLQDKAGVDENTARRLEELHLPEGYGRIGLTATRELLDELKKDVISYDKAVLAAPSLAHHSDFRTGEVADELPYYGEVLDRHVLPGTNNESDEAPERWGRLTNPTVHIGLGQLRRTVNAIIRRHGSPTEIVVELARDLKMNDRQRSEHDRHLNEMTKAAQARSRVLEELGIEDNGANRLRLRLWEELHPDPKSRCCIYTGEAIGPTRLFSGAVEVDHILPYSRTLDDSPANKMLIMREANRRKRNRDPYTAFGSTGEWREIAERAAHLPKNKRWRFAVDAMEKFEADGGFAARQLTDTQYLARLSKEYLDVIAPGRVWVVPGRLTEMLRRHWGLNSVLPDHNVVAADLSKSKNRLDHRHHAVDAAVIAATDRSLLNRISRQAALLEEKDLDDVVGRIEMPFPSFRDDIRAQANTIIVSHKPDHGTPVKSAASRGRDTTTARLHNDTAYGLTGATDGKGQPRVVHRVALMGLRDTQIAGIRDQQLRDAIWEVAAGLSGKSRETALRNFAASHPVYAGIRRVRVVETLSVIPVRDVSGNIYKGYKGDGNHCYEVWQMPDGIWKAVVVSNFAANSPQAADTRPHPAARKLMRLHQNDMIAIERDGERTIARVVKFGQNGQITLAAHSEAGDLKRRDARGKEEDPFKYFAPTAGGLRKVKARKVRVTENGKLYDPGPLPQ